MRRKKKRMRMMMFVLLYNLDAFCSFYSYRPKTIRKSTHLSSLPQAQDVALGEKRSIIPPLRHLPKRVLPPSQLTVKTRPTKMSACAKIDANQILINRAQVLQQCTIHVHLSCCAYIRPCTHLFLLENNSVVCTFEMRHRRHSIDELLGSAT